MPKPNRPTIEESATAFLRMLSGVNKSTSTITAYRTDLARFASILLTLYFLLGVSAGHQGSVGTTGRGCPRDTRGGVGSAPGQRNERDVAHRPGCLSESG